MVDVYVTKGRPPWARPVPSHPILELSVSACRAYRDELHPPASTYRIPQVGIESWDARCGVKGSSINYITHLVRRVVLIVRPATSHERGSACRGQS